MEPKIKPVAISATIMVTLRAMFPSPPPRLQDGIC